MERAAAATAPAGFRVEAVLADSDDRSTGLGPTVVVVTGAEESGGDAMRLPTAIPRARRPTPTRPETTRPERRRSRTRGWTLTLRPGDEPEVKVREAKHFVHQGWTRPRLEPLLVAAGFRDVRVLGGMGEVPYEPMASADLVLQARKGDGG